MAALHREKQHGRYVYRVQFYDKDGDRRSIRLGELGKKPAEAICQRVGQLVSYSVAGMPPDPEVVAWLAKVGDRLHAKLAAAGLVAPRESATLKAFVETYITSRSDAKPNTARNWRYTLTKLVDCFGADVDLRTINRGMAAEWRQSLVNKEYSSAVVSKTTKHAKQFFAVALRKGLVALNPFDEIKSGSERNDARLRFIDAQTIEAVIEKCPDAEWRAIVALARYGGLRTPSETFGLKWSDVDWDQRRLTVASPKTERHGKVQRTLPLFPELCKHLETAFDAAPEGSVYVVTRYRDVGTNLRTQFHRIIRRAGIEPWERVFHNLRASRQTELADRFPAHVVSSWLGNSPQVAERHYLQTTEDHFRRAVEAPEGGAMVGQQVVPQTPATTGADSQKARKPRLKPLFSCFHPRMG